KFKGLLGYFEALYKTTTPDYEQLSQSLKDILQSWVSDSETIVKWRVHEQFQTVWVVTEYQTGNMTSYTMYRFFTAGMPDNEKYMCSVDKQGQTAKQMISHLLERID
ncbi:hypothetical protein ACQVTS_32070, partial [Bacillus mycoides]|uniref:hypothetical protein n=1 Tax=Bacillus mycoides TaxID=1405 RepID=UPI003D652D57